MSDCAACGSPVRPDLPECENCGNPIASAAATPRRTRIDEASVPPSGLYRPAPRRTQIDADPFAAAVAEGPRTRPPLDPNDPFAVAAQAAPRAGGRRRTMVDGAAAHHDDPFARALRPAGPAPLERPLAGMLVSFSGAPNGAVTPLTMGRTTVGRDPGPAGPDVVALADDSISSAHCLIVAREAGVMLRDEMSSNGTHLRRKGEDDFRDIMAETVRLADGDQIRLGETILQVHLLDPAAVKRIWGSK